MGETRTIGHPDARESIRLAFANCLATQTAANILDVATKDSKDHKGGCGGLDLRFHGDETIGLTQVTYNCAGIYSGDSCLARAAVQVHRAQVPRDGLVGNTFMLDGLEHRLYVELYMQGRYGCSVRVTDPFEGDPVMIKWQRVPVPQYPSAELALTLKGEPYSLWHPEFELVTGGTSDYPIFARVGKEGRILVPEVERSTLENLLDGHIHPTETLGAGLTQELRLLLLIRKMYPDLRMTHKISGEEGDWGIDYSLGYFTQGFVEGLIGAHLSRVGVRAL